jgi:hypothetical protein
MCESTEKALQAKALLCKENKDYRFNGKKHGDAHPVTLSFTV